jgi:NtrC-family two-component system sensor histidine kinase KinB
VKRRRKPLFRSLGARFWLATTSPVVLLVFALAWSAWRSGVISREANARLADVTDEMQRVDILHEQIDLEDDAMLEALSLDRDQGRADLARAREKFDRAYAELLPLLERPEAQDDASQLRAHVSAYRKAGDALLSAPAGLELRDRYMHEAGPYVAAAIGDLSRIRSERLRSTEAITAWARDESRRSMYGAVGFALLGLVASSMVAAWLARRVVRPVQLLTQGVREMKDDRFDRRIAWRSADELGALVDGFNEMAERLGRVKRLRLEEIVAANQTLEGTLAALPEAIFVAEGDVVVAANPAARALAGACEGRTLEEVSLAPGHTLAAAADRADEDGGVDLTKALVVQREGGEQRLLPKVVRTPGDRRILTLYDVTSLARLDEMRSELVAVASHELKTPLTTLQMALAMLREKDEDLTPRQREILATAALGCAQLSNTVEELLDLARIEAGQLRLACAPIDLRALCESLLATFEPTLEESSIQIEMNLDAARPLWADRARLHSVLANLLSNAIGFSPRGGRVSLEVGADARTATFRVTDAGPGVPEDLRERVFEKFFRVDHASPRRGAGLGLYITRQIVEAHRGTIRCEAGPGGKGASFVVSLPNADASASIARPAIG